MSSHPVRSVALLAVLSATVGVVGNHAAPKAHIWFAVFIIQFGAQSAIIGRKRR